MFFARTASAGALLVLLLAGCGGGAPLLHPARTLPTGDVRAAAGLSGNVALGSLASDLRKAREIAASDPNAPGPPGSNPPYAKGALVAAVVAPGIAPYVGARVGIGSRFEGGIAYTGRAVRIDARRSFDEGSMSLSIGLGVTGTLYGRQEGTPLPSVDLGSVHGYGADVPILVGWQSVGGLYMAWIGARAGFEHDTLESLTSEPKTVTIGVPPIGLSATRYYGGGLLGIATGFRHVHVAVELSVAYQSVSGAYNGTQATVDGVTAAPATAVWFTF